MTNSKNGKRKVKGEKLEMKPQTQTKTSNPTINHKQ
jgi:hypothetical protein